MIRIKKASNIAWMLPLSTGEIQGAILDIYRAIGLEEVSLDLNLVDDAEIAELNLTFLGCDGPTNILSFPSGEQAAKPSTHASKPIVAKHIGWLALSLETTVREAFLYQQDVTEHAIRLLAHGILHLAGYDHGEEMFALTDKATESAISTLSAA